MKPELLDDETMAGLSDAAWRLWLSLVLLSDDYGNSRAMSRFLAARVWHDTSRDVAGPLRELIEKGRVVAYTVPRNGVHEGFVHIQNWEKHQRVDNAGKPLVPGPDHPAAVIHSAHLAQLSPRTSAGDGEPPRLAARARARGRGDSKSDRSLLSLSSSSEDPISDSKEDLRERGSNGPAALPPTPRKRAHRLPPDWQPSAELLDKMRRAFSVEPLGCLDAFKDWAASSPGAVKLDWDATFRSWVRREAAEGRLEPWAPKTSQLGTTEETQTPEQREAARKRLSEAMADLGAKAGLRHTFTGAK